MQGDGELQDWLHETGKDIRKMVGTHLKKAAKEKAVSYAQEQLGLGLADELGMAAKSVAKTSVSHALAQAGSVTDAASAKAAARSVGQAAKTEGISQLSKLAGKYFGGAGTPAQAVRVCAYNVTTLRKIVVQSRRELSSMSPSEFLRIHAKVGLKSGVIRISSKRPMNERLSIFVEAAAATARRGGYSAAEKRKLVGRLRKHFHGTPPSKMSRDQLIAYKASRTLVVLPTDAQMKPFLRFQLDTIEMAQGVGKNDDGAWKPGRSLTDTVDKRGLPDNGMRVVYHMIDLFTSYSFLAAAPKNDQRNAVRSVTEFIAAIRDQYGGGAWPRDAPFSIISDSGKEYGQAFQ